MKNRDAKMRERYLEKEYGIGGRLDRAVEKRERKYKEMCCAEIDKDRQEREVFDRLMRIVQEELDNNEIGPSRYLFAAHDEVLEDAVEYWSEFPNVIVTTMDGRRFRCGKEISDG